MARKKIIDDNELMSLIERFFWEECSGNIKMLKFPEIAVYVSNHGYPDYKAHLLRRNIATRDFINTLKNDVEDDDLTIVASYKTLDVDNFIENNGSINKMKKSLTALDNYYKSLSESATKVHKRYKETSEELECIRENTRKSIEETATLRKENELLKSQIKTICNENKKLHNIIQDYVYPEIANEFLKDAGLLEKKSNIIDKEKIKSKIISSSTSVKSESKVIDLMFKKLEE